ncbi:GLIPR1-like protein 1 [Salminus brasiliensis]|uniref:GLIPR1-like protein 1 n=1 Tax=Salminus brasiliensis TaxID=930266 RepID=UPI003B838845
MMGTWSRALTWIILLLTTPALTINNSPLPDITDQTFISVCVTEHNRHRSAVQPPASNMRYMTWDEGLAVTARAWARNCLFIHNTHLKEKGKAHPVFTSLGENLWAGTKFSLKSAIEGWVNEVKDYQYNTMSCNKVCGHYTQVVWASTYKVGCAVQFCPNGVEQTTFHPTPAVLFVCNYATAGNYKHQKPYSTGQECSECSGEQCENKLCRDAARDAPRRYNWTPDWDPQLSECGTLCKAILITRPVSLLLIFISAYCVQHRYPDLFAYT